ncbi:copper resistance protein B [Sphingosinicella sp. LHD-64]|uniref:copper resistance protein B n=1 Tax=Sphingosinicella sp. LHD-64 TaxID=3072139 RepID=UPI00280CA1FB|nr:copper resistance protein B [Sphingosinicella sp. LHD-64]MDQ8757399.1 copper resistance protein B [Sphingosinicella sp. LHD-64]
MTRFLVLLAASVSAPAIAQHSGHAMPASPAAEARPQAGGAQAAPCPQAGPAGQPGHAGHGAQAAPAQCPPAPAANPHAGHAMPAGTGGQMPQGHDMGAMPTGRTGTPPATDPHAGHAMPGTPPPTPPMSGHDMSRMGGANPPSPPAADPHAGHDMSGAQRPPAQMPGHDMGNMPAQPSAPAGQMPGHDMGAMDAADPPVAPPSPAALAGPAHAADTVYPGGEMVVARDIFLTEHGSIRSYRVLVDQLEARIQNGRDGYAWDAQAWYGGAINRLWLKTEGEGTFGETPEQVEVQALWSRALDPWFNLQAGVRYDIRPEPNRSYLVLGIQGLAPYWFEVDGAVFVSQKGDLSARFEGEYDLRITQRLILQPTAEFDLSFQDVPELNIGSGLSTAEAGLRLRYEFVPEFAPYVGVQYERAFGDTARFRRLAGDDVGGWSFLMGVRTWF